MLKTPSIENVAGLLILPCLFYVWMIHHLAPSQRSPRTCSVEAVSSREVSKSVPARTDGTKSCRSSSARMVLLVLTLSIPVSMDIPSYALLVMSTPTRFFVLPKPFTVDHLLCGRPP